MRKSHGLALAAAAVAVVTGVTAAGVAPPPETLRQLVRFGEAYDIIQKHYVAQVSDEQLVDNALRGMLSSLDPHSRYLTREQFDALRGRSASPQAGFGLELTNDGGKVKVLATLPGSPAESSAVHPGDYLLAVDGAHVSGADLDDAIIRTRGAPGSRAMLSIQHPDGNVVEMTLTRAFYKAAPVKAYVAGEFGVLRFNTFDESTGRETAAAIEKLRHDMPGMKGLVLDFRDNPGGLFDACVQVAGDFLDGGEIITQRGRGPDESARSKGRPGGDLLHGLPIVVLVNQGTAAGAEIIAAALQDRRRAVIVGLTTFGSGTVQTVIPLKGGQDGALKFTTSLWVTPSGKSFQRVGVEPDLEVARSREEAERLASSQFQTNEDTLPHALGGGDGRTRRPPHPILDYPPTTFDSAKGDYQLERALDVLRAGGDMTKVRKPSGLAMG